MGCQKLHIKTFYPTLKVVKGGLYDHQKSGVDSYRYGFQGQEKDDEIKGEGNSVNYKYRMHDPRIGRFFALDPLSAKYPYNSPYAFSENRVVDGVELEGLEFVFTANGTYLGHYGTSGDIRVVKAGELMKTMEYILWANDKSENGVKYHSNIVDILSTMTTGYLDGTSMDTKLNIAESVYKIWIEDEIPLKSMDPYYGTDAMAHTIKPGEFNVNVYSMEDIYDQITCWYHEEQHNKYKAEGDENSGNGFYHFEIGILEHNYWSYAFTTKWYKENWEKNMSDYLQEQRMTVGDPNLKKEVHDEAVVRYNKNVDRYNELFPEKDKALKYVEEEK